MKICILTHTFPRFRGDTSAPFMGELAEVLAESGNDVIVLTPFDERISRRYKKKYKLFTYNYVFPKGLHILGYSRTLKHDSSMNFAAYLLSPLLYLFGFLALLKLARREKVDIISSHWILPNGFIAALVSKITKIPFTITIPGSDIYMGQKNFFFKWMVGVAAKSAGYVVSDSGHYLKQLNILGFYPKRCEIIRYGVNTDNFRPEKKDTAILRTLGIKKDQKIILGVGRMVAKKGFSYLVEAMPKVLKEKHDTKLILIGDGDEKQRLQILVDNLGVKENVIFAGTKKYGDLSKYYNLADVFVMPSIKDERGNIDASPVAMMEAMACGIPVVATYFSGNLDLVIKGRTGYLVKDRSASFIAEAIILLLSNPGGVKFKKSVREIAKNNFSSTVISKKYTAIFGEIIR